MLNSGSNTGTVKLKRIIKNQLNFFYKHKPYKHVKTEKSSFLLYYEKYMQNDKIHSNIKRAEKRIIAKNL